MTTSDNEQSVGQPAVDNIQQLSRKDKGKGKDTGKNNGETADKPGDHLAGDVNTLTYTFPPGSTPFDPTLDFAKVILKEAPRTFLYTFPSGITPHDYAGVPNDGVHCQPAFGHQNNQPDIQYSKSSTLQVGGGNTGVETTHVSEVAYASDCAPTTTGNRFYVSSRRNRHGTSLSTSSIGTDYSVPMSDYSDTSAIDPDNICRKGPNANVSMPYNMSVQEAKLQYYEDFIKTAAPENHAHKANLDDCAQSQWHQSPHSHLVRQNSNSSSAQSLFTSQQGDQPQISLSYPQNIEAGPSSGPGGCLQSLSYSGPAIAKEFSLGPPPMFFAERNQLLAMIIAAFGQQMSFQPTMDTPSAVRRGSAAAYGVLQALHNLNEESAHLERELQILVSHDLKSDLVPLRKRTLFKLIFNILKDLAQTAGELLEEVNITFRGMIETNIYLKALEPDTQQYNRCFIIPVSERIERCRRVLEAINPRIFARLWAMIAGWGEAYQLVGGIDNILRGPPFHNEFSQYMRRFIETYRAEHNNFYVSAHI